MSEIVRETISQGLSLVRVSGVADSTEGPDLRNVLDDALAAPGTSLIVDLSEATFLDSSMLGALAESYQRSRPGDGNPPRMAIACPEGNVRSMFEITAHDSMLPIRDTVADAKEVMRVS